MDAPCAIQASIHVFSLVRKYVSRILGTYHFTAGFFTLQISDHHRKALAILLYQPAFPACLSEHEGPP